MCLSTRTPAKKRVLGLLTRSCAAVCLLRRRAEMSLRQCYGLESKMEDGRKAPTMALSTACPVLLSSKAMASKSE